MMKNDNRNDRRTSGPAKGTGKTKATGKANAAGKTKVTAGKENRVPVGQGREKTAVKRRVVSARWLINAAGAAGSTSPMWNS